VGLLRPFHYMNSPDGRPAEGSSAIEGWDVPAGGHGRNSQGRPTPPSERGPCPASLVKLTHDRSGLDGRGSSTRQARLNHKSEDGALRGCSPHQTIVCGCCERAEVLRCSPMVVTSPSTRTVRSRLTPGALWSVGEMVTTLNGPGAAGAEGPWYRGRRRRSFRAWRNPMASRWPPR
jgi:hypothetical protein